MLIEQVAKLSPMERLIYWINERESIRLKKEAGESPPWTDDVILQRYRFTNIRRMDDKVSRWLYDNWYKPNFDHPKAVVACALARFINLPESLETIGYPVRWNPSRIKRLLRKRRNEGNNIFNGAYMVRGNDGMDKIECVVDYYVSPLANKPPEIDRDSMEKTWAAIFKYYGMGSFMAGQIVADLRWAIKGDWKDRMTWAPAGPGSTRGLNRLRERPIMTPINPINFQLELNYAIRTCRGSIPSWTERLEAHDYQNCLCEFDKYERTLFDGRRPKSTYQGV